MTGLGIRTAALPSWRDLQQALGRLETPTVCSADPDSFTDPDPADLAYTTVLCTGCPVLLLCDRFAVANREASGIWAGRDRTPIRGRPAAQRRESECNV